MNHIIRFTASNDFKYYIAGVNPNGSLITKADQSMAKVFTSQTEINAVKQTLIDTYYPSAILTQRVAS